MNNSSIPTYKKIALDIANKIQLNNILEGDILHGRSTLSSKYNVSPETIRRSMILLEDVEVVKTIKGKG
ncbi:MAG: GntR family transcriptional regulator, partial [Clostridium sp.]|nr:GntR family transcriptional regulator [Clostridium sp.]